MTSYIKTVVVGDGATGKTSLLVSFSSGAFPATYEPTVFENYSAFIEVDNTPVHVELWDTAGQEGYDRLSYPQTDVFLLCFSLISPQSLSNAKTKWMTELRVHCPNTPIILVGTKMDLREDPRTMSSLAERGLSPVSTNEGMQASQEIKANGYFETSALKKIGLEELFQEATRVAISEKTHDSSNKFKGQKGRKRSMKWLLCGGFDPIQL